MRHPLDINMKLADEYSDGCSVCQEGENVPEDEDEWECPSCGFLYIKDFDDDY